MAVACPVCGHEFEALRGITVVGGFVVTERGKMTVGHVMETVFRRLIEGPALLEDLIIEVYGYRKIGPKNPGQSIKAGVYRKNPPLKEMGWEILNPHPRTRRAVYRLRKIEGTA